MTDIPITVRSGRPNTTGNSLPSGSVRLFVRAVGPTLADFGVSGVLADSQFGLTSG